jgi:cytochrome c nitrite reductase small subunit
LSKGKWVNKAIRALLMQGLPRRWRMVGYGCMGLTFGSGVCIFQISNATAYLSDDPKACINCHIMMPEYASWERSSHARVAVCNDCHVPHENAVRKYAFKMSDGLRHSTIFTLRLEPQVLMARPEAQDVIQNNCLRCHEALASKAGTHANFDRRCTECHRETPHGRVHSLSATPNASIPPISPILPSWAAGNSPKGDQH